MKPPQQGSLIKQLCIVFSLAITIAIGAAVIFYTIAFQSLQKEKVYNSENTLENLTQTTEDIASSVVIMAETVSTSSFTHSFLTEKNTAQKIEYQQILNRLVSRLIESSPHINNILLLDNSGILSGFSHFNYSLANKLNLQYDLFSPDIYSEGFTGALYLPDEDATYYAYIKTIYNDIYASNQKKLGTCIIICSSESLYRACTNASNSHKDLFAILDSDNQILASNHDLEDAYQLISDNRSTNNLTLQSDTLTLANWNILCSVPYSELYSELLPIRHFAVLLISVMLFSFLLLAYLINKRVICPLLNIVNFLNKDAYYILHNQLEIKENNEIGTLSININQMLNQINELTHTVLHNQSQMYEAEISKNHAQILALQTQISPHFLFNTLNSIKGLAYQKKIKELCASVDSLSYVMRYTLYGNNLTSIKNELLCIEKYLQIINLRFPDRFLFRLNVDKVIYNYEMPRFLLQPLVENSISHGLEPKSERGTLTLTALLRDNSILHFECTDDGVGISPDKLVDLRQKLEDTSSINNPDGENQSGIGLFNIHARIRLIYGVPYGLSILSSPEGTTICMDFPSAPPNKTL